jgi:hypothetical protein
VQADRDGLVGLLREAERAHLRRQPRWDRQPRGPATAGVVDDAGLEALAASSYLTSLTALTL